jgi:tetratricopeptide (TPR) repeat protein
VRITAQLIDVSTGSHVWAERYDRSLAEVFAMQDEITEAIVAAIEPQLYAAENFRARRKPPESLDVWNLVMRALSHYWRVTRDDNLAAQRLLEQAIAIDPNYGQALAVLAVSHTFGTHMGWEDRATAVPAAERAALAAMRADSEDPWAHLAMATVYMYRGRFQDSLAEFETRWLSSRRRYASIRTSRWRKAIMAWRWHIASAGTKARMRLAARCA